LSEWAARNLSGCAQATTITGTEVLTKEAVITAGCAASHRDLEAAIRALQRFGLSTAELADTLEDTRRIFADLRKPKTDKRPYWRKLERRRKGP
jgi:hypothetical protein